MQLQNAQMLSSPSRTPVCDFFAKLLAHFAVRLLVALNLHSENKLIGKKLLWQAGRGMGGLSACVHLCKCMHVSLTFLLPKNEDMLEISFLVFISYRIVSLLNSEQKWQTFWWTNNVTKKLFRVSYYYKIYSGG